MVAIGLALSCPAMSGAEPWIGSYKPLVPSAIEAEASSPIEPTHIEARSERMSPNRLPVTTTSNCPGFLTSCIAALSTYMWLSATSGYSAASSITTSRQTCEVSSTLALSTEQSLPARPCAALKPTWAMRRTSLSE